MESKWASEFTTIITPMTSIPKYVPGKAATATASSTPDESVTKAVAPATPTKAAPAAIVAAEPAKMGAPPPPPSQLLRGKSSKELSEAETSDTCMQFTKSILGWLEFHTVRETSGNRQVTVLHNFKPRIQRSNIILRTLSNCTVPTPFPIIKAPTSSIMHLDSGVSSIAGKPVQHVFKVQSAPHGG